MSLLDRIAALLRNWTFGAYRGETIDCLLESANAVRAKGVVKKIEAALLEKWRQSDGETLSDAEWDILAVSALQREVNNGGYRQFFFNNSRFFATIVAISLGKMGCENSLSATNRALSIVGTTDPQQLRDLTDYDSNEVDKEQLRLLDKCAAAYYASGEKVYDKIIDFVREHRADISLPGFPSNRARDGGQTRAVGFSDRKPRSTR